MEHFGEYYEAFEPWQFAFHFFSRSIPLEKIRLRDPGFAEASEAAWRARHGVEVLDTPLAVDAQSVPGRLLSWSDDGGLDPRLGHEVDASSARVLDLDVAPSQTPVADAAFVIVTGGEEGERISTAERLALDGALPVLVEIVGATSDRAATLVLSGRADAVISK